MQRFLKHIGLILVIYMIYKVIIASIFFSSLPQEVKVTHEGDYSKNQPNMIFVGASNLYYNYDYNMVRKNHSSFNVSSFNNSATKGGFFILDHLQKLNLSEEDILVFCLPHSFYESEEYLPLKHLTSQDAIPRTTLVNAVKANPALGIRSLFELSVVNSLELSNKDQSSEQKVAVGKDRNKLNSAYNDSLYETCWSSEEESFTITSEGYEEDYIRFLSDYITTQFPCKVVFRFPPLRENDFSVNSERVSFLEENLHFLNTFSESIYSKELFFDQWYHLNKCGREQNSEKVIAELKEYLVSCQRLNDG